MSKPLSQQEVDSLQDGTLIEIFWSGWGNSSSIYIYRDTHAWMREEFEKNKLNDSGYKGRYLNNVGSGKCDTRVFLANDNLEKQKKK